MARRKSSRGRNKIQPAVLTMPFVITLPPGTSNQSLTCDLSQCASLMNRRFYRQGINWAVAGFKLLSPSGVTAQFSTSKLPNSWVLANSWEKSMRTWSKMNREALAETESVRPKFLDFKIYADSTHHNDGFAANLLPAGYVAGEWESSKVIIPETTTATGAVTSYELIAVGANNPGAGSSGLNAKSLIEGYAASRGLPNVVDPNTPDDAASYQQNWMMAIFNEGNLQDNEIIEDMIGENNLAPYPFENDGVHTDTMYPNGANQAPALQIHDIEFVTGTTIGGTTRLKGGNFPCGLIRFDVLNAVNPDQDNQYLTLLIDMVPGNHRGYLCEPMTEM